MLALLRTTFFWVSLFCFSIVLSIVEVSAQGCNGANGTGIFNGSIANRDNGTVCANNPVAPALMEIDISNIDEGGTVQFEIDWDDGSAPELVNGVKIGANRYFASRTHFFPPNGAQVKCEYIPDVRLRWNGTLCAATLGTPPRFVRWNTDDQNTGELNLVETITNVNTYYVCAGVETNVTFTDRSTLNCVPPDLILGPNNKSRWRQFIYGTSLSVNGTVEIGGIPRAFPFNGTVDGPSTEPTLNSGFPTATTQVITVPATAQVGDFFEITMNYWNTCNPFPGRPPVLETARIEVIGQPPAPTGTNQTVCNGTTPGNFVAGGIPGGMTVNWYRNVPGSPDAPGTLITSGGSTSLPITSVPGYTNNTTAGVYKVWVSYRPNVANALNCESPRIAITSTIRESLTVPNPSTAPPAQVCNNNSFSVVMPAAAATTIGGNTQYVFNGASGVSITSSNATSATFLPNIAFGPGELFVDRTISVVRRYSTAPNCDVTRNFTVRIFNDPVGGTPSDFPDVCEGTAIGPITLSGHLGNIEGWQVRINAGAYGAYGGPASGNSITPGVLPSGGAGTLYTFRAIVGIGTGAGTCPDVFSAEESVFVSPNPGIVVDAGPSQQMCNVFATALSGSDPTPGTGTWSYLSSVPAGKPSPTFTPGNRNTPISVTAGTAGAYTMRWTVVSGACTFVDDVVIDFGVSPVVAPMADVNVCGETATMAAALVTTGTGAWTCVGACPQITIVDPTSETTDVNLNAPGFAYGTYTLRWTVTSGSCPTASDDITVTFNQAPTVTAIDINGVCLASTGTAVPLGGTFGGGATSGSWVNVNGTGVIGASTVAGNNVTATYTSSLTDYSNGTPINVKLVATPGATSACAPVEQIITINVDRTPVPIATTPRSVCESFILLDAQSPIPFGATGQWTGPAGITFDNPTDPQTTARNLPAAPSSVTLRWTLTSAGGNSCPAFINVQVTRVVAPSATNLNLLLCESQPAGGPLTTDVRLADYENAVTSIPAGDRNIQWYQDAPPPAGIPVADPNVVFLNVPDGKIYVARIQQISTGCTSDAFVTINVRSLPAGVNTTVAICEDTPASNTASNVDLINDITFKDAVTDISNNVLWYNTMAEAIANAPATEITAPLTVTGGRFVYARITYSSGPSCVNIAELNLSVKPLPTNSAILGRSQVCLGDPSTPPDELPVETYQVSAITGAKYYWTVPTGPGKFKLFGGGTEDDFFMLLQFPNIPVPNPENISVRVELNGCSSPIIQLPITVSPQPVDPIVVGTEVVCENENGVLYEVNPSNFPTSNYNWEIRKRSDDLEGGAFVSLGQGTNQIRVNFTNENIYISVREVNSICVSDTTQYWVNVNPRPVLLDADVTVCSDSPTGVEFQAATAVPIAKYDINTVVTTAGIGYVTPPSGPAFPLNDVDAEEIEDHVFSNVTAVPLSVDYTVTPIFVDAFLNECPGAPQVITVNVNPEPQLSPGLSRSICSGEESGITLISAANTFPADRFIISEINFPLGIPLTPVVAGNIANPDGVTLYLDDVLFDDAWINTTGSNQIVEYKVLPYSTLLGCTGNPPTAINVTIFPRTDVDPVTVAPICNGDLLDVTFNSTNNGDADFLWIIKTYDPWITVNSTAAGLGNIDDMILTNTSLTQDGTVTFEVRGKNQPTEEGPGGCQNPVETFVVTVLKSPIANAQNLEECSDDPGGNTYTADLKSLEPIVTPNAGDPDTRIIWYRTDPRLGPATVIPDPDLNAFVMGDGIPVFVEVEFIPTTCKVVVPVQYTVNPQVSFTETLSLFNTFNLTCNGDNSGQIRVDVNNGTPAYSYRIDGGPFINAGVVTYNFSSLAAGTHTVEVQDIEGCTASKDIDLIEPPPLTAVLDINQEISCFLGRDGVIMTLASGGTGTYISYLLLQTNATDTNNDGVFDNLGAGTYNVRVTDLNNCKVDSNPVILGQPTQVEINSMVVATDANGFNLSCANALDGEIEVTFSGGNTPPDYTITLTKASDPLNPNIANTSNLTQTFTDLGFGNYTAVVTDAKGCESLPASAIIVNPPPFSPGFVGINQSICVGDDPLEIDELVPAFGGVGNYQYQWQQSDTGNPLNDSEWIDVFGATGLTYDPGVLAQTMYYRRIVQSVSARTGVACETLGKDNVVQVLINPLPVASFNAPSEVCQGESFTLQLGISAGTAPIEYDYSAGTTTFVNLIGTENTSIPISNFQVPTTYTLLRVKDLNGCLAATMPPPVTVDVIKINPDFTVLAPIAQCSGGTFTFQWVAEVGVKYTWIWSDGQQDIIDVGDVPLGVNTITHVFTAGSTESSTIYPVRLQAENALCAPKFATHPITVFPTVVLNISPGDPILCSGETIRFVDQSQGVDIGKWYYQVVGTTNQQDIRTGPVPDVTYTMINNTASNPILYEVVYEASNNEGCSDEFRKEVKVYRGIAANIISNPDPPAPFAGGVSTITFTNNSVPLDAADFEYSWDFGDARANPPTGTGTAPFTVDYFSAGIKDVILRAINIDARDIDNKTCQSQVTKKINIELPILGAEFKVSPHASCFPVDLVVENLSPGADTFLWEVYDGGGLVTTSTLRNPVFRILKPGTYDIYLTASFYATGQTATANVTGIKVFDVPSALFEMRPNPIFVPDTQLQTFNQSVRANQYSWDFDDGSTSMEENPTHLYKLEGKYNVTLVAGFDNGPQDVDGDGINDMNIICYDTVRHELVAQDGGYIKLPNAFTPNPNGSSGGVAGSGTFNDVFLPIARGVEEFQMDIFDRWGNLIFESKDRNIGWDGYDRHGRLMPAGVYVYKLVLRLSDGQRTTKVGDVTLIR